MPSPVGLLQQVDSISWGNPSMARPQTTRIAFLSLDLTEFETWILPPFEGKPLANHAIPIRPIFLG